MADLEAIAAVEALCFPAAEAATKAEFKERLARYADHFWLMFEGDTLISFVDGFATDEKDLTDEMFADASGHDPKGAWQMIFGVNTVPSHRRRGYAGQLLQRAIDDAKRQGRKGLVLTCKQEKLRYYARFGFVDEGVCGSSHGGAVWHQMRLTFRRGIATFPSDAATRQRLRDMAGNRCDFTFPESREAYLAALPDANILIGEPRNEDFSLCRKLELLHSPCSGVNYYVEGGKFPANAILCCASGQYGNVIAEHMLALTLALCRRLPEYRDQQHAHRWELRKFDFQLEDATVLILGAGDIGTTLARWMKPLVKRVIGMRRVDREYPDCFDRMITPDALDDVLPEADIILCALPHTPETVRLLNEDRLRRTKKDAILVNGGRGSLIDQEALCALLQEGHFFGVGLEVTSPEPLPGDHPLWDRPRLIITPHASGNSFAPDSPLVRKIWNFIISNVDTFLAGGEPDCRVDFSTGYRRTNP